MTVVVKHLAREVRRSPKWIREQLRMKFGNHPVGRRWSWDDGKEADRVRAWLRNLIAGREK